ncbi:MAG: c-type cytochrome domain-containing protein, partial [Bacteroidota bacterium]
LVLILLFAACDKGPSEAVLLSQYPEDLAEVMITSCATEGCHSAAQAAAGLDLSTWDKMLAGGDRGTVAVPFEPVWSEVLSRVNQNTISGPSATDNEHPALDSAGLSLLKAWLETGARSKDNQYPWTAEEQSNADKLFTLCAGSDLIAVTQLSTNRLMRYFAVGSDPNNLEAPHFIALSPDKQFLYVSLIEGGFVEKYRTDNYDFVERVAVGSSPSLLTLSPDGKYCLISHFNSDDNSPKLSMINTESMDIVGDPLVASGQFLHRPHGLVSNQDFSVLYVGASNGNYYSKLEIDPSDANGPFLSEEKFSLDPINAPSPMGSVDYQPYYLEIDHSNKRLFISCNATDEVRVFDLSNDQLIGSIPTADYPRLMAFDPIGERLFVACRDEANPSLQGERRGCVSVLNVADLSLEKNIYDIGHVPHGIAYSPSQNVLVVNSENNAGLIAAQNPTAARPGPVGQYSLIDGNSLTVIPNSERQLAVLPNACVVSE